MKVLRLDQSGLPIDWIRFEDAAVLATKDRILWHLGDDEKLMLGGTNNAGEQSRLIIPSIIAVKGRSSDLVGRVSLNNETLFRRDQSICMYCGHTFHTSELTRDHVIPRGQGGLDCWTNVVAACKRCNNHKDCRTPEEAGMPLLAVPFEPNWFEYMFLKNNRIKADQMEYLKSRFSNRRNWSQPLAA